LDNFEPKKVMDWSFKKIFKNSNKNSGRRESKLILWAQLKLSKVHDTGQYSLGSSANYYPATFLN